MAKLSVSVDVPLAPEEAWQYASDLSRYKEWLTIHRVWRSALPETLDRGTEVESIVEVKGMPNRIKWTIVNFKPPQSMTLDGVGVGGVKVKLIGKVRPNETVRPQEQGGEQGGARRTHSRPCAACTSCVCTAWLEGGAQSGWAGTCAQRPPGANSQPW